MDCCNDRCLAEGNREHRSYDTANGMDCCNSGTLRATLGTIACYDTANGMDCCNCHPCSSISGILALRYRERYGLLQQDEIAANLERIALRYRERYGLLQLDMDVELSIKDKRYDTANGMDCCNLRLLDVR